jgi:ABC-2 type transport system permease protein
MHREFRGESLSEVTQPNRPRSQRTPSTPASRAALGANTGSIAKTRIFGLNNTVIACLQKEFIYLRRNINQLYGFIVPIFMVFLFAGRMTASERFGDFIFPIAIAYSIFGVSVLAYNALGMDGTGVQFYFLSPTRLRDVFLAKNLMGFLLSFVELVVIFVVISFIAHPPALVITLATVCWLLFTTFINGAVGNLRSLMAPKKIDLTKVSRKQASQLSILISLGVVLGCLGIGYAVIVTAGNLARPWLMVPIFLALALIAFIIYLQVLNRLDAMALNHREDLAEELCKA